MPRTGPVGYTIGLAVFAGFGSAERALDSAAAKRVAYEVGLAVPTAIAQTAGRPSSADTQNQDPAICSTWRDRHQWKDDPRYQVG